ncbi:hypothetical protein POM88_010844 [Heracleum sosnowskyi]|uniref:Uncharacterized protein n=1 Tax=Heracleum sosnowskyi TaxID=360622 RepID=A0AAD8N1Y3_9APIA|nr:hypothetical protein POM88_010844 [Heracleum sosnowskyi]
MENVKCESTGAYEWLSKVPLHHWTRARATIGNVVQKPETEVVLAITLNEIKKSKKAKKIGVAVEEMRRATIKKEQASKIDAMKAQPNSPRRSSRLHNMTSQVIVDGGQMHNSYTGAMRLGSPPPPPVKQYKTIVGGTTLKSAPFQSHGKTVITKGTLQTAAKLQVRRKIDGKK